MAASPLPSTPSAPPSTFARDSSLLIVVRLPSGPDVQQHDDRAPICGRKRSTQEQRRLSPKLFRSGGREASGEAEADALD